MRSWESVLIAETRFVSEKVLMNDRVKVDNLFARFVNENVCVTPLVAPLSLAITLVRLNVC